MNINNKVSMDTIVNSTIVLNVNVAVMMDIGNVNVDLICV